MHQNEFYLNELFPTRVVYREQSDLVTPEVLAKSKDILTQYADKPFYSPCISTVKTFYQVLDLPEFYEIKIFISETVSFFLKAHKIDPKGLNFLDSWLNQYDLGGYQDLHHHHDSMISGVFYIQSAGQKDFIIQAPWHFQQPKLPNYYEHTIDNSHNIEYNSIVGRSIIFMSHALHRTLPAIEPRISLSFNIG